MSDRPFVIYDFETNPYILEGSGKKKKKRKIKIPPGISQRQSTKVVINFGNHGTRRLKKKKKKPTVMYGKRFASELFKHSGPVTSSLGQVYTAPPDTSKIENKIEKALNRLEYVESNFKVPSNLQLRDMNETERQEFEKYKERKKERKKETILALTNPVQEEMPKRRGRSEEPVPRRARSEERGATESKEMPEPKSSRVKPIFSNLNAVQYQELAESRGLGKFKSGSLAKKALKESTKPHTVELTSEEKTHFFGQGGGGLEDGLYNDEIEKIAKKSIKGHFVPVLAQDEIGQMLHHVKRAGKKNIFGAVINTNPSTSTGDGSDGMRTGHWVSVIVDNRDDFPSIEYFDPLCQDKPSVELLSTLKTVARTLNPSKMFKFKINKLRRQSKKTGTCGVHSLAFVEDRIRGVPWSEATGYDHYAEKHPEMKVEGANDSADGEKKIKSKIKKYKNYI